LSSLSIYVKDGEVYLNGYLPHENDLARIESTIYSVVGVLEVHNHLQTNDSILADIWDALWKEDTLRSLDLGSLSIHVKGGEVYLYGHIARENNLTLILNIAHSIEGVVAVHNNLVSDHDLTIQVAQALARDERTRPLILPVKCSHGWISLGGEMPTQELQQVAEKVTIGVPGVRGVVSLPRVAGQSPDKPRRTMQPRIGAIVYGKNGAVGIITQVVIQPDHLLVTHIVIRSSETRDGNEVARETVVPLKAIDLVKQEGVFLMRNGPWLDAYPVLDPDDYPLAPFTWKAPYPYTAGNVLWSLREILDVAGQPGSEPETEAQVEVEEPPKQVLAQAGLLSE
jgi:osmotically-inducible protein OsmY